jgi:hypothetical protein
MSTERGERERKKESPSADGPAPVDLLFPPHFASQKHQTIMYVGSLSIARRTLTPLLHLGLYVNLDPAAEQFDFEPDVDIKDLISIDDAMEEMQLGPNGAMVACFE